MKPCSSCHRELPLEAFHRASARRDGRQRTCKECQATYQRTRDQAVKHDRWLFSTYGMRVAEYAARANDQGGRCSICDEIPERRLVVDHDHACCPGRRSCGVCVRGLICDPCNRGLGAFRDNPARLSAAINYLKEF